MSDRKPKFSVCIPAYNAGPYLGAAIESVLGQDFEDLELFVSDDRSDDETPQVCDAYRTDPRFRAERSQERLGQSGNWNRCLTHARGDYVMVLHADDQVAAGYLDKASAILDANADVGLVHCAVQHIDDAGEPLELQRLFDTDRVDREDLVLRKLLLEGCVINPAGVTVRRTVYDEVGPFTDRIVWGVDWHMWIRVALRASVGYLAEPLALYRHHGQSGTSTVMRTGRNARDEAWAIEDVFELVRHQRPELYSLRSAAIRGVAHRTWCHAEKMCELGDMPAARTGIRNAVRIWPGMGRQARVWGLWLATFTGYRSFAAVHSRKQRLTNALRHLT